MAILNRLLLERNATLKQGSEDRHSGAVFAFTHTNVTGVLNGNPCAWTWTSPGAGIAIVELWGASGTGPLMCCCGGNGLPGNPGAYLRKCLCVSSSSCVCGWVGCSPWGSCLCWPGRSGCSVACPFNTSDNTVLTSTGGWGGFVMCTTGTALYCCFVACGFNQTLTNTFCGIICNVGGPNAAAEATASGGNLNIPGGISCVRMFECCNFFECNYENTIAVSPGIYSSTCATCFRFMRAGWPYEGWARHGSYGYGISGNSFMGRYPTTDRVECWTSGSNICGCYEHSGCVLGGVGYPGTAGHPCPGVRSSGQKGGHGGVKITFYS
jgi:hypothetical protein